MTDLHPRYTILEMPSRVSRGPRWLILDRWYSHHVVASLTNQAAAVNWCADWNAEHDAWLAA